MSSAIHLRLARSADANAIRDLMRSAYAKWVPLIGREPTPMSADYDAALRDHRIDLLYLGGALVALIETIPKDGHLLIENVAVLPSHQGRGLGRMLLDHAERIAASLEHREVKLYTNKRFEESIGFYLRRGYNIEREEDFAGGVCVHMNKFIDGVSVCPSVKIEIP